MNFIELLIEINGNIIFGNLVESDNIYTLRIISAQDISHDLMLRQSLKAKSSQHSLELIDIEVMKKEVSENFIFTYTINISYIIWDYEKEIYSNQALIIKKFSLVHEGLEAFIFRSFSKQLNEYHKELSQKNSDLVELKHLELILDEVSIIYKTKLIKQNYSLKEYHYVEFELMNDFNLDDLRNFIDKYQRFFNFLIAKPLFQLQSNIKLSFEEKEDPFYELTLNKVYNGIVLEAFDSFTRSEILFDSFDLGNNIDFMKNLFSETIIYQIFKSFDQRMFYYLSQKHTADNRVLFYMKVLDKLLYLQSYSSTADDYIKYIASLDDILKESLFMNNFFIKDNYNDIFSHNVLEQLAQENEPDYTQQYVHFLFNIRKNLKQFKDISDYLDNEGEQNILISLEKFCYIHFYLILGFKQEELANQNYFKII